MNYTWTHPSERIWLLKSAHGEQVAFVQKSNINGDVYYPELIAPLPPAPRHEEHMLKRAILWAEDMLEERGVLHRGDSITYRDGIWPAAPMTGMDIVMRSTVE